MALTAATIRTHHAAFTNLKKSYAYTISTGKVDCVSDKFGSNTYPDAIGEIEFDEQPFLDWQRLGGDLYFQDGKIVHIPVE